MFALSALMLAACGSRDVDDCGFADELLPYDVGNRWSYEVTELVDGNTKDREVRIDRIEDHPDFGEVLVEVVLRGSGTTEHLLRREGDRVLRLQKRELDAGGALEVETTYEPYRLRIDESLAVGERVVDSFTEIRVVPGATEEATATNDVWEVVSDGEVCPGPFAAFTCVRYRRFRTDGGSATREYLFARGVGKVFEDDQAEHEELIDCGR